MTTRRKRTPPIAATACGRVVVVRGEARGCVARRAVATAGGGGARLVERDARVLVVLAVDVLGELQVHAEDAGDDGADPHRHRDGGGDHVDLEEAVARLCGRMGAGM